MPVYKINDKNLIASLFDDWDDVCVWSCLQDCMGVAYADDKVAPKAAQIILGDFCYFSGDVDKDLVKNIPEEWDADFLIMVPQNRDWEIMIEEVYKEKATRRMRYATKKEVGAFDKSALQALVAKMPSEYELKLIDKDFYKQILSMPWAKYWISNFNSYEEFQKNAMGVMAMKDGEILAGASTYAFYKDGIEIEIDTREDHRRKGLALVCGAKIMLECLDKGLYPNWDAKHKGSLALAEKLGYKFDHEYPSYEIFIQK